MSVDDFQGRTAVVTGAASGIGFALAERFVADGARVALADIEEPALEKAAATLRERGGDVVAVVTDVSEGASVDRLAAQAADAFGPVHILCNNAAIGVSVLCPGWVNTNIHDSGRNRPGGPTEPAIGEGGLPAEMLRQVLASGMDPAEVARLVARAITTDDFYVFTHPEMTPAVEARMQAILRGENPKLTISV